MRHVSAVLGVVLVALAGCNSTRFGNLRPGDNAAAGPAADGKVQSVESIIAYLYDNASRVKTLQATSLEITAAMGTQRINLRGKLVAEKPRGLRMSLDGPLGFAQMADLGSNNDEFWFWIKAPMGEPPAPQFFCSYRDLEKGVPFMPMPFQPEWVMETLGLGPFSPPDQYKLDYDEQTLRLTQRARSPQGTAVRKVIVLKRRATKAPDPQVTHYLLLDDATGREICSAHIKQTMVDPATGAIVPKELDLNWRQQNATLSILLGRVVVNAGLPPEAFVRRPLTGVQSQNLALVRPGDPAGVQRVQGLLPPR